MNENLSVKAGTIVRTVCLILAIVNNALTLAGKSPLPIEDEQLANFLSMLITTGVSLWNWWKNNSFTRAAIVADEIMHDIKSGRCEFADDTEE